VLLNVAVIVFNLNTLML